jgi:hypothetical protein
LIFKNTYTNREDDDDDDVDDDDEERSMTFSNPFIENKKHFSKSTDSKIEKFEFSKIS